MSQHNHIEIRAAQEGLTVPEFVAAILNRTTTLQEAADQLGVSYRTLYRYMKEHDVERIVLYQVRRVAR